MNLNLNLDEINISNNSIVEEFNNNITPSESFNNNNILIDNTNDTNDTNDTYSQTGGSKEDKLELERGTIVRLEDKKTYIIVKVFDVYFDDETNDFKRNYRIRQVEKKKNKTRL